MMKRLAVAIALAAISVAPACGKKKEKDQPEPTAAKITDPAPTQPDTARPPQPPDPALIQAGAYIANVTGCVLCHTGMGPNGPDLANPFAGGLEVTEQMGPGVSFTWRAPNITPDADTGIGSWTDEQIAAAVRIGVNHKGSKLAPIMPYYFYNAMSDDDVKALIAFLRSQKPVSRQVLRLPPAREMAALPPPPAPSGTAWPAEKRGEYLATLMHCSMCHTPFDAKTMMPDMKRAFAGGNPMKMPPQFKAVGTGVNFSANLTSDKETGLGAWSPEQIAAAIKTMTRPDGRMIGFPMAMYQTTWSQLTDEDAMAVAGYIKNIPAIRNKVPNSTFKPGPAMEAMKAAHDGPGGPAPK